MLICACVSTPAAAAVTPLARPRTLGVKRTILCPVLQARFGTPKAARAVVSAPSFERTVEEPARQGRRQGEARRGGRGRGKEEHAHPLTILYRNHFIPWGATAESWDVGGGGLLTLTQNLFYSTTGLYYVVIMHTNTAVVRGPWLGQPRISERSFTPRKQPGFSFLAYVGNNQLYNKL